MKHKRLYVGLVLAILGIAVLVVSMTVIYSQTKAMLGIVLGGALVQAGIAAFAIDWPFRPVVISDKDTSWPLMK